MFVEDAGGSGLTGRKPEIEVEEGGANAANLLMAHRLREARDATGLTRAEVSRRLASSEVTLYRWEKAENRPRARTLAQLSQIYGRSVEWLEGSNAPPGVPEWGDGAVLDGDESGFSDITPLPLISAVVGNGSQVFDEMVRSWIPWRRDWLKPSDPRVMSFCFMDVWGDSMPTSAPHGSFILVDRSCLSLWDMRLHVLRVPNVGLVVRLAMQSEGVWFILAENRTWKPFLMSKQVEVFGLVTGCYRGLE